MKYMLKYSGALVLMLLLFSACRKEPNFDMRPHIEFKRIEESVFVDANRVKNHQISVVVYFQDGDGNLGLSTTIPTDQQGPFKDSPYNKNFIVKLLVKESHPNGTTGFVEYQFPVAGFDLSGRFPRISNDDRAEPLEGEIKYTFTLTSEIENLIGKTAKFEVFIYDRTLPVPLKSNVVTTNELVLLR